MNTRMQYKGYIIESKPYEVADRSGWRSEIFVEQHTGSEVIVTQFYYPADVRFATREAAIEGAFASGRAKIDVGFVPAPVQQSS